MLRQEKRDGSAASLSERRDWCHGSEEPVLSSDRHAGVGGAQPDAGRPGQSAARSGAFYGALDDRRGRDSAVLASAPTPAVPAAVGRWLRMRFATPPILWRLDRAPWQHGRAVDERLAENPRLALRYFPPAGPELKPQQPVWQQPRHAVCHHHP